MPQLSPTLPGTTDNVTTYQVLLFDLNVTDIVTINTINHIRQVIIAVDHVGVRKKFVHTYKHVHVCEQAVAAHVTTAVVAPQAKHRKTACPLGRREGERGEKEERSSKGEESCNKKSICDLTHAHHTRVLTDVLGEAEVALGEEGSVTIDQSSLTFVFVLIL